MIVSIKLADKATCNGCPLLWAEGCRMKYKGKRVRVVEGQIVLPRPGKCVKEHGE